MPELQSVAEDMITDALAHPQPAATLAAARQTTTLSRKEDGPHVQFFQRDATSFHNDLDGSDEHAVCPPVVAAARMERGPSNPNLCRGGSGTDSRNISHI